MPAPGGKSRGCFQCSKRRIICDNTEPTCRKCQKKGIECSGAGRIRFSNGVAQRGRLRGCTIPEVDPSPELTMEAHSQGTSVPRKIRWKNDPPVRSRKKTVKHVAEPSAPSSSTRQASDILTASDGDTIPYEVLNMNQNNSGTDVYFRRPFDQALVPTAASINPWIAPLNSQTRMLMTHFSEQVAPVMVVLDHISNGYRDIILPLACEDELVRRAVGIVAEQHLALQHPSYQPVADEGRTSLISRLCQESLSPDRVFNISTWATLIVLLVGETVTGSSEYGHLLRTLACLVRNIGQIAPSLARNFLVQQTHMFEFLGKPLLGEKQGVNALRLPLEHYLDWTYYDLPPDSEYNHILHLSRMAFIKASQIYLGRVASDQDQWELLESMKQLVSQIKPDQMGSHALVWVCFIAAADSTDPEHRRFFVDRMNQIFAKIKFQNISAGIRALPAIWSQHGISRWTENIAQLAPTLIM